jgi:hypothetical protein
LTGVFSEYSAVAFLRASNKNFCWRSFPKRKRADWSVILVQEAAMSTAKQDVEQLLNRLPDDCSVEDIQYHLYVLDKVRRGLEDASVNGTLTQQEVEDRLGKWLTK